MNPVTDATQGSAGLQLTQADLDLLRTVGTNVWELVDEFSYDFANELHQRVPELGKPDDTEAVEQSRRSSVGSMYEFLSLMRASMLSPNAMETSAEALEHVRFLQSRGIGLAIALRFYHVGVSMFLPVVLDEFERCSTDQATLEKMRTIMNTFIVLFVDQVTKRLAAEYGVTEREGFVPDPNNPVWHDPEVLAAARQFLSSRAPTVRTDNPTRARRHSEQAIERFCNVLEAAAMHQTLGRAMARADTTVRLTLADDEDLAITLLLDRKPIEVVDGDVDADVELSIMSVDLDRLCSPDFHLAMAVARGRVTYEGNVRKFLRITPIIRHASLPSGASSETHATAQG